MQGNECIIQIFLEKVNEDINKMFQMKLNNVKAIQKKTLKVAAEVRGTVG